MESHANICSCKNKDQCSLKNKPKCVKFHDSNENARKDYIPKTAHGQLPVLAYKKLSLLPTHLENEERYPPWKFQWIIKRKLALMAWPQYPQHLRWLLAQGIRRLVTLSSECRPPIHLFTEFFWIEIPVGEFCAPTLDQIKLFICFCDQAMQVGESIGIHCRVGHGVSGTLAACYLVRYCGLTPDQAIMQLRRVRTEAIDTLDQEAAVGNYYYELCRCPPDSDKCWNPNGNQ